MKRLLLTLLGATLSLLLVGLPAFHVTAWTGQPLADEALLLTGLPLFALAVALFRPEAWATLFLFPVAHLPVLAVEPRLTGRLVYAGATGGLALGAITLTGLVFGAIALSSPGALLAPLRRPGGSGLAVAATVAAATVLLAFLVPAFDRTGVEPPAAQVAVALGLALSSWVGARVVAGWIGDLLHDPRASERTLASLYPSQRLSPVLLWGSLALALGLGAAVLGIYRP